MYGVLYSKYLKSGRAECPPTVYVLYSIQHCPYVPVVTSGVAGTHHLSDRGSQAQHAPEPIWLNRPNDPQTRARGVGSPKSQQPQTTDERPGQDLVVGIGSELINGMVFQSSSGIDVEVANPPRRSADTSLSSMRNRVFARSTGAVVARAPSHWMSGQP
jgi:hypothetical protein